MPKLGPSDFAISGLRPCTVTFKSAPRTPDIALAKMSAVWLWPAPESHSAGANRILERGCWSVCPQIDFRLYQGLHLFQGVPISGIIHSIMPANELLKMIFHIQLAIRNFML